jgi:TPP-dependent pyruvate/acetoin dehydrogenase alpha subunit
MDSHAEGLGEGNPTSPGLTDSSAAPTTLSGELLHRLYEGMVRSRLMDSRGMSLQRQGRISFYVPAFGEEAAQIGSAAALSEGDWIFPCYREAGAALYHGLPLQFLIDQVFGNGNDLLKGRQMPNHFGMARVNFAVASSPVGTQIPQAVGAAWAFKLRQERKVALVYFGDGATSTGEFHTGLNTAGVHRLPAVFLCKNNQYAISTPVDQQTASETLAVKAVAYGIPGIRVNGNDVLAVYGAVAAAVARARSGGGPTLIEVVTFRMGPHTSADDPSRYRTDEEAEEWGKTDPIAQFCAYLEATGLWGAVAEAALRQQVEVEIQAAVRAAESAPTPALETLVEDVYAEVPRHLREQFEEVRQWLAISDEGARARHRAA